MRFDFFRNCCAFRLTPDPEECKDGLTGATPQPTDSAWVQLDLGNDTIDQVAKK